jgi:hypothetical protein
VAGAEGQGRQFSLHVEVELLKPQGAVNHEVEAEATIL